MPLHYVHPTASPNLLYLKMQITNTSLQSSRCGHCKYSWDGEWASLPRDRAVSHQLSETDNSSLARFLLDPHHTAEVVG